MRFLLIFLLAISIQSLGSVNSFNFPNINYLRQSDDFVKTEIDLDEIPEEIHIDVRDSYHNALILKAYKITYKVSGEKGYMVTLDQANKNWNVIYDEEGNAKNRITPL